MTGSKGVPRFLRGPLLCVCVFFALLGGCATLGGKALETRSVSVPPSSGTFTLILFGARYGDDLESVAVMDKEGDEYTMLPFAPDFDYKVKQGNSAAEALKKSSEFVSWHINFVNSSLREIMDDRGAVIGYEIRPLYNPLVYGTLDVLDILYTSKGGQVYFTVKLKPSVQRLIDGNGSRQDKR